jgi:hypothetical protein
MSATRVVHCKRAPFDVYIGRPSKWGNRFTHLARSRADIVVGSREEAVARYKEWILTQPELLAALSELQGKVLGCWCAPKACHGHVLAELADLQVGIKPAAPEVTPALVLSEQLNLL